MLVALVRSTLHTLTGIVQLHNHDCVEYLKTCHFSTRPSSAGSAGSSSRKISRPANEDVYVGKYKLMKTIGKGNFAKVKLAKHMPTGQEVGIVC